MKGSMSIVTEAVATEAFWIAHPIKNPIDVAHKTSRIRINAKMKNRPASAVSPTAKYTQTAKMNGKMSWNGISMIDLLMK